MLNRKHSLVQAEIEIGDGLPDIRLTTKCLEALKQAGFEVNISFLPSYCSLKQAGFVFTSELFKVSRVSYCPL